MGSIEKLLLSYAERGVPTEIVMAQSLRAMLTLCVESFFPMMRDSKNSGGGNPYALDCAQYRESCISEMMKALMDCGFSNFTGFSKHYVPAGSKPVAMMYFRSKKDVVTAGASMSRDVREKGLKILRQCARLFRGSRMQRVTDKGKFAPGTVPTQLREGFRADAAEERGAALQAHNLQQQQQQQQQTSSEVVAGTARMLYHANTIIVIKIVRPPGQVCPFQLVYLMENLTESWVAITKSRSKKKRRQHSVDGNLMTHHWVVDNAKPLVTDFHQDGEDSRVFKTSTPAQTRRLNCMTFYGSVDDYFSSKSRDGEMVEFEISDESYEAACDVATSKPVEGDDVDGSYDEPLGGEEGGVELASSKRQRTSERSLRPGIRLTAQRFDAVQLGLITQNKFNKS